jgi:ribosomal protein L37AE/L43A
MKKKFMWDIIRSEVKKDNCSKCGKYKYVVKVFNNKTGEIQWRCNNCVRKLKNGGREFAHHILTPRELEELRELIK